MKKIMYFAICLSFLIIPNLVKADNVYYFCENYNFTKIQKLAANIVYSYDYEEKFNLNEKYGNVLFNVKISNLNPNFYLVNNETNQIYRYAGTEIMINNIQPGTTLSYTVYSSGYGCIDKYVQTFYVNIPSYNKYYIDELCLTHKDNKLCQKWSNVNLTYDEFKDALTKYDKVEEPTIGDDDEKTFEEIFIEVIDYLDRNKLPIFGSIILISSLLIIYLKYLKNKELIDFK